MFLIEIVMVERPGPHGRESMGILRCSCSMVTNCGLRGVSHHYYAEAERWQLKRSSGVERLSSGPARL